MAAGIPTHQQRRSGNHVGTVCLLSFSCWQCSHLTGHSTHRHDPFPSNHPGPGSSQMGEMGGPVCHLPTGVAVAKQKTWDSLVVESCFSRLLNQQAANPRERAQLQACSQRESGAWLTAPPINSPGLPMCNATICIATSLRLGAHLCAPHDCTHCGRQVDETGLYGLRETPRSQPVEYHH